NIRRQTHYHTWRDLSDELTDLLFMTWIEVRVNERYSNCFDMRIEQRTNHYLYLFRIKRFLDASIAERAFVDLKAKGTCHQRGQSVPRGIIDVGSSLTAHLQF